MSEKLVSSWFMNTPTSMPENYVFPPETRPGDEIVPLCSAIPVVDMSKLLSCGNDRTATVRQIVAACEDFGFFQVINHGVKETLVSDSMKVFEEFFAMPMEDKAHLYSKDPAKSCRIYTSSVNYDTEPIHYWRDCLRHFCHPLEEHIESWPQKPENYREVVGKYVTEMKQLSSRILESIREGLGLEMGHFDGKLSADLSISINHYPPCPQPSLALGLSKHSDPTLITILLQGQVPGLQVLHDGKWVGVEPLPNAFVINVGSQLKIVSNGRLISSEHRVVTNSGEARTTATFYVNPSDDCIVEPAQCLVDASNPPIYKAFQFKDFFTHFLAKAAETEVLLQPYKVES